MKWKQHLTTRVASSFLLLSLVAVGIVGGVAYLKAKQALQKAAFNQLQVTATLKEEEINRWFEDQQRDFLLTTQFPDVRSQLKIFLSTTASEPDYQTSYQTLSQYFQRVTQLKPNLGEIFLLNRSNQIILSTNKKREGNYEILANITYLEEVEPGDTFAPIFYVSPDTGKPSVTLATPLYDEGGTRQGIILVNLNLERIDRIVREGVGVGESVETYLVGSLVTQNTFISKEPLETQEFPDGISSQGIDAAMSGISGSGLYHNYAGKPVLGVYRWLNDQDLALLVEISQQEAFAPAQQLAGTMIAVGLGAAGVLLSGVYWLSQQLSISRRQLEDYSHRLEHKAQEAEAASRAKSEFLANMSHELRTPLNAILGFAQLMERDRTLKEQQRESLATINRSGEHLLSLINDVLEMSKIEAGRTVLSADSFDLHRLLRSLQEMFQMRAATKGLSLSFELAADLPRYIVTDQSKLRQVLINLLGNAIKFTEQGSVTLRASVKELSRANLSTILYLEIEDTGKGIALDDREQLFDPFVQTASGIKSEGGTGLGLAISRQFVRLMGGDIGVSSTLGQGSLFYFALKVSLAPPTEEATGRRRVLHLAIAQPSYRILIVDDISENRNLLTQLLEPVGFQTRTASNGTEAIALRQEWQPHLIWMDMRMPILDGYEATRQIRTLERRRNQPPVPIIALTAIAFDEQQTMILGAGCDDWVRKPFQESVIFEKMAHYLKVEYLYESSYGEPTAQPAVLTAQDLTVMPAEWIDALQQAAIQVDAELIGQLIAQIPPSHHSLAEALTQIIHQYDFDQIIELCGAVSLEKPKN